MPTCSKCGAEVEQVNEQNLCPACSQPAPSTEGAAPAESQESPAPAEPSPESTEQTTPQE